MYLTTLLLSGAPEWQCHRTIPTTFYLLIFFLQNKFEQETLHGTIKLIITKMPNANTACPPIFGGASACRVENEA